MATQLERIAKMEIQIDNINEKVEGIDSKLDKFIESADSKYASKNVEKVVYGLIGIILTAVVFAILTSIGLK